MQYRYRATYRDNIGKIKEEKKDFPHGITSYPKQWLYSLLCRCGFDPRTCQEVAYRAACECLPGSSLTSKYKTLFSNQILKIEAKRVD